ncbi:MAG: hypothetical protein HDS13_08405 [Bacteroides sp.]|nr:hypothetical protein [Bacteroides sp.]
MLLLVGQERPHPAVAQTCLIRTHVRSNIDSIEVEAATQFRPVPIGIAAHLVAVKIGRMFAVDTLHLHYIPYLQSYK